MKRTKVILYLFSFLLLVEWLRPLEVSTDTEHSFIFMIFIAISLLLKLLQVKWLISYPIKIFFILFFIQQIFYEAPFFSFQWLDDFFAELLFNFMFLNGNEWVKLTPVFRTTLFFIMLWLLVYLIYFWVIQKYRILFFLFLTFFYVGFLDTFTPYDATYAIVRLVIIGFFMLGFLSLERLYAREGFKMERHAYVKWGKPLVFLISLSVLVGFISPKWSPIWPDPVPYIKKIGSGEDGEGESSHKATVSKIGYGENDEQLGGPFIEDDTVVFRAYIEGRHYWRVETKDVYTGKGWVISNNQSVVEAGPDVSDYINIVNDGIEDTEKTARVDYSSYPFSHFAYPVETKRIEYDQEKPLILRPNLEKMEAYDRPLTYTIYYQKPVFQVEKLKEVTNAHLPEEFKEKFTQVPSSVPERVRELATEITKDKETLYDKVKAVEQYFAQAGFVYETQDVQIPKPEQDYVDQFLFETKKGYCDNYSTSMIVLLRSLDIPARWVKGYTQGEFIGNAESGEPIYEVTNNNAHSWVEVYFDGIGWVPFEPTRGFRNPAEFTFNLENNETQEAEVEQDEEQQQVDPLEEEEVVSASKWDFLIYDLQKIIWGVSFIFVIITLIGWLTRKRWYYRWIVWRVKRYKGGNRFSKAYTILLKQLENYGLEKRDGQTLRQFAKEVDVSFGTSEMSYLTEQYEQVIYRGKELDEEWDEYIELWENLIKKTTY